MSHPRHSPKPFEPKDPDWEAKVRESFRQQGIMELIGATLHKVEPGRVEIHLPFRADLTQQNGFFHAGVTSTIVDSAGGYAGHTLMPPGAGVLTVEFKLNLLAPADGDLLVAEGQVLKPGRNLVITRGEVYVLKNGVASHCATMQQTLMTMHGKA